MSFIVTAPFSYITDSSGNPLNNGYIYFGAENQNPETNPIPIYWDASLSIPAANPVRTINGYISRSGTPANIYTSSNYSITAKDSNGRLVYNSPSSSGVIGSASIINFSLTNQSLEVGSTQQVAGINVLRTISTVANRVIYLKYHTTAGDGGHGYFRSVTGAAPGTYTDNGGTIIVPTGGDGSAAWLRDYSGAIKVRWFGSSGIQSAIDYAISSGVYSVENEGTYTTTSTINIGSYVKLYGGEIVCSTNNIPIILVNKGALNAYWQVRDISLRYSSNQPATNTNAAGIRISELNKISFEYDIANVNITGAFNAIDLPEETGCYAFLGRHTNIRAYNCSGYSYKILGALTGANTNLLFDSCYAVQTVGSEIVGSAFAIIKRVQDLRMDNCAYDHCQGDSSGRLLVIETCTGSIGNIAAESCDITISSGTGSYVEVSGSSLTIGSIKSVDNNINISGTASFSVVRAISSSQTIVDLIYDKNTTVTDTSSGAYYTIIPDSTSIIVNEFYKKGGATPAESIAEFGTNTSYSVRRFNGNDRTRVSGGKYVLYGTAAPTTGTWATGDRLTNTSISNASPVEGWVCISGGTPGVWNPYGFVVTKNATASRPTLTSTDLGVMYLDTTLAANGKPIWWNGALWVDSTGASV